MPEIKGPPAEIRMVLKITDPQTGKTETVELIGTIGEQEEE